MKLVFLTTTLLLLLTAAYSIGPKGIEYAQKMCKANGGLNYIIIDGMGEGDIHCNNGAKFRLNIDED